MEVKLKSYMESRKLSSKQLAEMVGISLRSMQYTLGHVRCPNLLEMERYAQIFGVYIEDLYVSPYSRYYNENGGKNPIKLQNSANFCVFEPTPLKSEEK